MKQTITDKPCEQEQGYVVNTLWKHNAQYEPVDIRPLFVNIKDETGTIIAGLVARTWWGGLDIQYLWVSADYRKAGLGSKMMRDAEAEALNRGCHFSYVDTLEFQARGFYEKLGYRVYGHITGFAHKFSRYYLSKPLSKSFRRQDANLIANYS